MLTILFANNIQTKNKNHMMQIITANSKYFLRAEDVEDVINWVWSIQLALSLDLVSVTNRRLNETTSTPSNRPSRIRGGDTSDRIPLSSSVHTGNSMLPVAVNPIVEHGDYYSQLSQIRGYFHDADESSDRRAQDDSSTLQKPTSFGEPLSRVPSVSIFRSLPHFHSNDLPDDHLGSRKPPIPRGGVPVDPIHGSYTSRPSPDRGGPLLDSTGGAESLISPSSSLGRSSAIPIVSAPAGVVHVDDRKISGSFREEDIKGSPIMALHCDSGVRSPVNPITWSPEKAGTISPVMSPYRSRGDSEEGYFCVILI